MQQRVFFTGNGGGYAPPWNGSGGVRPVSARRTRNALAVFLLLAAFFLPAAARAAIGGSGTASNPYTINSVADWVQFRNYIDGNLRNYRNYWKLTTNISLAGGDIMVGNQTYEFEGVFDGGGYTITVGSTNMYQTSDYVGLFQATFGTATNTVTIKNLNVNMGYLDGSRYSGALIGEARASLILENVHVTQIGSIILGIQSGGLIGKFFGTGSGYTSNNCKVSITNCSYINTGSLDFAYNSSVRDIGGFVGHITANYSSIIFTDCLVSLKNVTNIHDDTPFGDFIGSTRSNVSMIRCVQEGDLGNASSYMTNASNNRAYLVGYIANGVRVTGKDTYSHAEPYRGIGAGSTGNSSGNGDSGFAVNSNWTAEEIYNLLERKNDNAGTMPAGTAGNRRWGYLYDYKNPSSSRPELSSTYYTIKITKGEGINYLYSTVVNYFIHTVGNDNYLTANRNVLVYPSLVPTAHQRINYTFTKAYEGDATQTPSRNNLILNSTVDGRVSATITNIPYPYTTAGMETGANAELLPFDKKIRVTWNYDNPDNLTSGKFYVYYKKATASAYTRSAAVNTANNSATGLFQILNDNKGIGLIFETEGDTLAQTFKSEHGNYSDGFRKAFHHETISYNRRKDREFVELETPKLSAILSGTPKQVSSLIPNAENGLFSRFIFYYMNLQPIWKDVFANQNDQTLDDHFNQLGNQFLNLFNVLKLLTTPLQFSLTKEQQQTFNAHFSQAQSQYLYLYGIDYIATIRRLGLITFRIAMILTTLRIMETGELPTRSLSEVEMRSLSGAETTEKNSRHCGLDPQPPCNHPRTSHPDTPHPLICSNTDFTIALQIVKTLIHHAAKVFDTLPTEKQTQKAPNLKQQFLENLPQQFSRKDYLTAAKALNIPDKTAEKHIAKFTQNNLINHFKHDQYKKN